MTFIVHIPRLSDGQVKGNGEGTFRDAYLGLHAPNCVRSGH